MTPHILRQAGWLPQQDDLENWLAALRERAHAHADRLLHPSLVEFRELIDADPIVRMYVHQMIEQEPGGSRRYSQRHIDDVPQLLALMNEVLTMAPEFDSEAMVMIPLAAVLDWTMGTTAGFAAYRDRRINVALHAVLRAWCEFLDSPDSRYVLNDGDNGWKSSAAQQTVGMADFEHDPDDEFWGFRSWNDFFTRRLKPGARPVASPDDDSVIVAPCEATPYALATGVQRQDRFWIKSQPYSLQDMLAGDESVEQFVDGTVYQAFLSATNYHRWHSPVAGTVVRAFVENGTFYSEADAEGDASFEPQNSQGYLAHVATRAIFIIDADNPAIGQVAVVQVGMVDVSSCVLDPEIVPGHHLAKGDELGCFQFGGSTYCLVLRPGVVANFALDAIPRLGASLVRVHSHLATVRHT
ncbi:phosphatidylserine decarboxylase family protein [uncultured Jatrophihabitans sp.]|uniref:phosphatidylserine decarboxylase family protein n=1 Tax=uncultured Jatrophihabitans sp. TaxID=1610747 RepID=UPI0035CB4B0B